jgi:predicted alpha/beta-fold hydrolase
VAWQTLRTNCINRCSRVLKNITTPTLIIHAQDDPLVPANTIPTAEQLSASTTLELSPHDGHLGFVGGSWKQPVFWVEQRISNYLAEQSSKFVQMVSASSSTE